MPEGVYVGRRRPIWRIVLFQILTLGVYGRVWLYRTAQELDGHEALFLDRRLYLLGVLLPVGGPLVVKWRLVNLVRDATRHDPTAPPLHAGWLKAAAFVPYLPVVHALLQRHLKHHWTLHRKLNDLEGRREVLEVRRRAARTAEEKAEVQRLDEDLRQRESVLAQAREAAMAIREAVRARARAEEEIRAAGGGASRLERVRSAAMKPLQRRYRRDEDVAEAPEASAPAPEAPPLPAAETAAETPRPRMGRRPKEPAPEVATADEGGRVKPPSVDPLPDIEDPSMSKKERKLLAKLRATRAAREKVEAKARLKRETKAAKAAEKEGIPAPPPEVPTPGEPSKKEVKLRAKIDHARAKREAKEARAAERAKGDAKMEPLPEETPSDVPKAARFSFGRRKASPATEADAIVVPREEEAPEKRSFFRRRVGAPTEPDAPGLPATADVVGTATEVARETEPSTPPKKPSAKKPKTGGKRSGR